MVDHPSKAPSKQQQLEQLEHLRDLVVGPTERSLDQLREEIQTRQASADEVSEVLPAAIRKSASNKDFARSLAPTLTQAFEDSVRRDPKSLADAIAPIMGPAIRRSISEQIRAMVQSLNTALEHSLSPKSIGWRIEALRTGKPFAEIVLLHTLIYRIDQLLLIHPETGLLMQSASVVTHDDADLVSSLLSAIQDFMRDSFEHRLSAGSDLTTLNTNELTVWIEHGPNAILAAAVRGEPPLSLRQRLKETLERMHIEQSELLSNFSGDTNPMDILQPDLEDLLVSEFKGQQPKKLAEDETREQPAWRRHLPWAVATCLLLLIAWWLLHVRHDRYVHRVADVIDLPPSAQIEVEGDVLRLAGAARHEWIAQTRNRMDRLPEFKTLDLSALRVSDSKWVSFIEKLRNEPGTTVISTQRIGDRYLVHGWRDPLSKHPDRVLEQVGLSPAAVEMHWKEHRAVDPRINLKRLKRIIEIPSSVLSIEIAPGTRALTIVGSATAEWRSKLGDTWEVLDTDTEIDDSGLRIIEPDTR